MHVSVRERGDKKAIDDSPDSDVLNAFRVEKPGYYVASYYVRPVFNRLLKSLLESTLECSEEK